MNTTPRNDDAGITRLTTSDTRSHSPRDHGVSRAPAMYIDSRNSGMNWMQRERDTVRAADRHCQGCDRPAHEVGVLIPCEATYRNGNSSVIHYCGECFGFADEHPGWLQQNCDIVTLERISRASSMPQSVRDVAIIGEIRAFEGRVLAEHFGGFAS